MVMLTNDLFENIQKEAVAILKFNPPDDVETVEIDLKLVDRDLVSGDEIMDISPRPGDDEDGKVVRLFFSLKKGTWWGDDYINDHKDYFGYGHLSGCGDGSCGDLDSSTDIEPFVKYYDDIEALGYDLSVVNITDVQGWDGIMAHYLYWILDEYCTWEGLHYGIISSDLRQYGIEFKPLPTIMSYEDDATKAKGIKWSELSTPQDYKWFNAQLENLSIYFEELYKKNWTYFTTDHWHTYQKSAWEILVDMISKPRFFSIVSLEETVYIVTVDANINFDLDTDITQYEPKVGPYTGVGYYLEVNT